MFRAVVWDLETTGLDTFMGKIVVASFLDLHTGEIKTRDIIQDKKGYDEGERRLVAWTLDQIQQADVLVGHNTVGYDLSMVRGRAAQHGLPYVLPKRTHIDTLQVLRHGLRARIQGNSLENALDFFHATSTKYKPSKHVWHGIKHLNPADIQEARVRCEEDVRGNAELWGYLREAYHNWRGRN